MSVAIETISAPGTPMPLADPAIANFESDEWAYIGEQELISEATEIQKMRFNSGKRQSSQNPIYLASQPHERILLELPHMYDEVNTHRTIDSG